MFIMKEKEIKNTKQRSHKNQLDLLCLLSLFEGHFVIILLFESQIE